MRVMDDVLLADGKLRWPAVGLGTWRMGESARLRRAEIKAVRLALELGYRLIDTAEMYGDGGAEEVVGAALAEALSAGMCAREDIVVVSKVLPSNASRRGVVAACDRSRRRLDLDRIDAYLLHWPGSHPLNETLAGFAQLCEAGSIGNWGVSNFDVKAMHQLFALPAGQACVTNQVYYSLGERGVEFDLLPWQRQRGIPLMAYCPIDQGAMARDERVAALARPLGLSAAQLALTWLLRDGGVVAVPKAVQETHLRDNLAAAGAIELDAATRAALDRLYPPPRKAQRLAIT
jgi:diketogulonate reductase-like aldo/keto reductase